MKKIITLALALVMALSLVACGEKKTDAPAPAPADDAGAAQNVASELKFTTGGEAGTYYGFGTVLANQVSANTASTVTAIVGQGSKGNIELMDLGDAQLGFVQSDVMAYAYNGTNLFEGNAITGFSTVAALYMEQVQIVTLDPNIKSVADLRGKTVSVGASGSGVYFNAIDVLAAYDMTLDDINPTYQSFADSTEALQDGKIDAGFIVAGAPTTAVTSLAASRSVYLVELDDEHIDKLMQTSPYYSKNVISKDAYGLEADATTVAVGAVVIARDDVSEDDVYNFVSGIFESVDTLGHDKKNELSLDFAASVTAVPYHPGAAKYFAEKGITVPVK
ncbi:MAG: TAXI family TRAP transporter solute-binding subunit [Oscillibacter sp.]|nr:TAXI family TRAP transporter solute-binding subunit [Oscillibacter sp.]